MLAQSKQPKDKKLCIYSIMIIELNKGQLNHLLVNPGWSSILSRNINTPVGPSSLIYSRNPTFILSQSVFSVFISYKLSILSLLIWPKGNLVNCHYFWHVGDAILTHISLYKLTLLYTKIEIWIKSTINQSINIKHNKCNDNYMTTTTN